DEGNILLQKEIVIEEWMRAGELQSHMDTFLPEMLDNLFSLPVKKWTDKVQEGEATYCYQSLLNRENAELNVYKEAAEVIVNKIRAFYPEPTAWIKIKHNGK